MFKSSYNLVECDALNEEHDTRDTKDLINEVIPSLLEAFSRVTQSDEFVLFFKSDGILPTEIKKAGKWARIFGNAGLFGTSFNFINSIIGSGVIGKQQKSHSTGS